MHRKEFTPVLIAPCGMNCGICKAYLAYSRGVPKQRGKVTHRTGCLPHNKNCFIKRGCKKLAKSVQRALSYALQKSGSRGQALPKAL